jgi:hypothetical protein
MSGKFIDFEEVEQLATIEQLADVLGLNTRRYGASGQVRCSCPQHGGGEDTLAITPTARSRRGSLGVFFCRKESKGGDRIGLVAHCLGLGQQEAAFYIQDQFGTENGTVTSTSNSTVNSKPRATVPPEQKREPTRHNKRETEFDPETFRRKLKYTDEVATLGFSEEDAERFDIGFYRGMVYVPVRHPNGSISGFIGRDPETGDLKLPPKWLEPGNVVPLPRRTA